MSSSKTRPSKPSIVAHRWFPKFIGVWFAALFGLCSLAVAPEVLERIVTTLGIDRIVPAAAPPLGETARLLLAMGMAGVGEIAGLVIGGWLAASHRRSELHPRSDELGERDAVDPIVMPAVRARDRHADAPPRKPLSAIDDLGDNHKDVRPSAHADALDLAICDASSVEQVSPLSAPESAPNEAVPVPVALIEPAPALAAIASAPLETLGVVQLSERLALALQARRERRAQRLATAAVLASEAALDPEMASASQPRAEPPFAYNGEEDDEPEESADQTENGGYSSLLAMGSSIQRPEPVRIEEPQSDEIEPVVIFPGQIVPAATAGTPPPADAEETDRALRAALASLQRISGAR